MHPSSTETLDGGEVNKTFNTVYVTPQNKI